jgi:hypothetical protein
MGGLPVPLQREYPHLISLVFCVWINMGISTYQILWNLYAEISIVVEEKIK